MAYCTADDIADILSVEGMMYRIDDNENVNITPNEDAHVTNAINYGTQKIDFWCRPKYKKATLEQSAWITFACTWLSSKFLCIRRGQGVPSSIEEIVSELEEMLRLVYDGRGYLPDVTPDTNAGISSIVVGTMRMGYEVKFRKNPYVSTAEDSTANNRFLDWRIGRT